jgi:hypothetical protein
MGYPQGRMRDGKISTDTLDVALRQASWPTTDANMAGRYGQNPTRLNPERTFTLNDAVRATKANLATAADQASGTVPSSCLALTEKFVVRLTTLSAWLMGYTGAYLRHWETASSRKSRKES